MPASAPEPVRERAAVRRRFRRAPLVTAGAVVAICAVTAADATAQPLPIGPFAGKLGEAVVGGLGGAAVGGFADIIKALFSFPAGLISRDLLAWLVSVPNYAIAPTTTGGGAPASNLAELGQTTTVMAFATLAAFGTVSCLRYWVAGLASAGGAGGLEGLARTVAAALFLIAWPWLFRHSVDLANEASRGLLSSGSVLDDTARILGTAFSVQLAFNFFSIVIACIAGVLFLTLLMTKILVSASTAIVYVAMPLAALLWVVPELSWVARAVMRTFAALLLIPLAWSVCFATFGAVGVDALALKGGGSFLDTLLKPLIALALLWLTVTLPRTLGRLALAGGQPGGFVARSASYITARRVDAGLAHAVGRTSGPDGGAGAPATAAAGQAAATGAGAAIAAAGGAPLTAVGAVAGARQSDASTRSGSPMGSSSPAPATPQTPVPGAWRIPSWGEISARVPSELLAAAAAQDHTRPEHVAQAMASLRPDARRGVADLMSARNGNIRGEMAHQAAREDLTATQRDAFRTLAAAAPDVRADGIARHLAAANAPAASGAPVDAGDQPASTAASAPVPPDAHPPSAAAPPTHRRSAPPPVGEQPSHSHHDPDAS